MYEKPREVDDTDAALLARAARGSRDALAGIARRYVAFVYNTAVRHVRDTHLAEDVTQAVFLILARKAHRIKPGTLLHAWLFATTRFAARNALRMQARRAHHESKAAAVSATGAAAEKSEPVPILIGALLDDALAALGDTDRSAVLLSYFGEKNWREVGAAIGASEDAARKRVGRAVAQMRAFFVRRGVHVSAAAVATSLTAAARASAPAGLVESVACCAAAPALSGSAAAQGVIAMMISAKLKLAAAFALPLVLTIGIAGAMVMRHAQDKPTSGAAAAGATDAAAHSVVLDGDVAVELLEVSGMHGDQTWGGDGKPVRRGDRDPDVRGVGAGVGAGPGHVIVARVVAPGADDMDTRWQVKPSRTTTINHRRHDDAEYAYISMEPEPDQRTVTIRVEIARGEWRTAAAREGTDGMVMTGSVAFGEVHEADGRCAMTVTDEMIDHQSHVVAVDVNGQEHPAHYKGSAIGKAFRQHNVEFPLPAADIERIDLRTRPYDQWVELKNVSLAPDRDAGFAVKSSAP